MEKGEKNSHPLEFFSPFTHLPEREHSGIIT